MDAFVYLLSYYHPDFLFVSPTARLHRLAPEPPHVNSDFLGRATLPTVTLLHPPSGGVGAPITIPLLPSKGPLEPRNTSDANGGGTIGDIADVEAAGGDGAAAVSGENTNTASPAPAEAPGTLRHLPGAGRGTERFATRMMHNVQKHLRMDDTITGTLTVSLELFQYGDEQEEMAPGGGVREPGAPPAPARYAAAKFKVAEDAAEAKRRRDREGIRVPRMLSRVTELHDKLNGDQCHTVELLSKMMKF